MRWLDSITDSVNIQEIVEDRGAWHAAVHRIAKIGHSLATEQ